jgi:hypothetical protein
MKTHDYSVGNEEKKGWPWLNDREFARMHRPNIVPASIHPPRILWSGTLKLAQRCLSTRLATRRSPDCLRMLPVSESKLLLSVGVS